MGFKFDKKPHKGTLSYGLVFKPTTHLHLEGFWDADGASSLDDRKSVIGICVFLRGNLITWSSRKQRVVACSSTEAEYRALASAATKLVWIQNLLAKIGVCLSSPTPVLWSDNLGAQALACSPVYHARTKHIELDVHFVRNLIVEHKLEPADLLTKALPVDHFHFLCTKLTMVHSMSSLRGSVKVKTSAAHLITHDRTDEIIGAPTFTETDNTRYIPYTTSESAIHEECVISEVLESSSCSTETNL